MDYKIMHKDRVIAFANENGIYEIIEKSLCPACFAIGMPLEVWLDNRSVDIHRSHLRKLFKALRLRNADEIEQIIDIGHGITITDNWWIQKYDENLDYSSLKRYNEEIADIALYGASAFDSGNIEGYRELGTVGSYEKAWRFIDGSWYMFKQGNIQELISEYYSYVFLKSIGVNVAEYDIKRITSEETGLTSTFIITKDFTGNAEVDFEPFCNYYTDHDEPEYIISRIDKKHISSYVMMVFYDVLLHNEDRHNQNAGFLRNTITGEIIDIAPYFDYNLGLISTGVPRIDSVKGNVFTKAFLENDICCSILKQELPDRDDIIRSIKNAECKCLQVFSDIKLNYNIIHDYIISTYDYFSNALK